MPRHRRGIKASATIRRLYFSYAAPRRSLSHFYGPIGTSFPSNSKEAAVAVVTLERTGGARRLAARLKAMAAAAGAVIDSYVNYRMQTSASEAEHVRRQMAGIAKPASLTHSELLSATDIENETERALQPLDPGTISDVIPAFFVGRNHDGLWVAREAKGAIGGMFLFKDSATSFARRHAGSIGSATIFPPERFELDLANSGNPLAPPVGWSLRLVRRLWRSRGCRGDRA